MRIQVLVTDYDGTLAENGRVDASTLAALQRLRDGGRRLVLATGRILTDLESVFEDLALFDRVVAENGAVLLNPSSGELRTLAEPPPPAVAARLSALGATAVSVGKVIVATWEPHEDEALRAIRELELELQVIFNKGAVMILPSGVNKATGVRAALAELQLSSHNTVAVGDAENDHALLMDSAVGVAVENAVAMLKERADWVTAEPRGAGVAELVERVLATDLSDLMPAIRRHDVPFGETEDGTPAALAGTGASLLVCGRSGGGKSTLIAALIEELRQRRYQFCALDPEGDFSELADTIVVGDTSRRPGLDDVVAALSSPTMSVVVNLMAVPRGERAAFARSLLERLREHGARAGRPHFLIFDEAHHVFERESALAWPSFRAVAGSLVFVTVEADTLAPELLSMIDDVAVVGPEPETMFERFAAAVELGTRPAATAPLTSDATGLWWSRKRPLELRIFRAGVPRAARRRHKRKYATGDLGPERSFYFTGPERALNLRAKNLIVFLELGAGIDDATWTYHAARNDYSTWLREAVKDADLASEVSRIEARSDLPPRESRALVASAIERRYTLPGEGT